MPSWNGESPKTGWVVKLGLLQPIRPTMKTDSRLYPLYDGCRDRWGSTVHSNSERRSKVTLTTVVTALVRRTNDRASSIGKQARSIKR
jgi:hypothetical protein